MSGDRPIRSDAGVDAAGATAWSADTASRSDDTASGTTAMDAHAGDDGAQLVRRGGQAHDAGGHGAGESDTGDDESRAAAQEAEEYVDPKVGPVDLARLPGPFTPRQLARIDEALSLATSETGLLFSLYVGELGASTRAAAERLAGRLPSGPEDGGVLVAASPGQRVLHIVTTRDAVRRLPNRVCALAALSMRAAFSGGDLTAGAVNGLRMLADAAGHYSGSHLPALAPAPAATSVDPGRH